MEDDKAFFKKVILFIHKDISHDALNYLVNGTTRRHLKKNELFIDVVKKHNEIGFVEKGLVRGYYLDKKGDEINTRFIPEGQFATHYKSFINQEPSKYYFKAVEKTSLLCFDYEHIQKGYELYPDIQKFGRLVAEQIIRKLESRLESQHFDDASKRYYDFMEDYPNLHNRLSLTQIASYIRITRPALSRLRSKL